MKNDDFQEKNFQISDPIDQLKITEKTPISMIWHEPSPKSVLKFGTISTPLMYEISARNHHNFNAKIQDSAQHMLEIVLNFNLSCKKKEWENRA